MIDQLRRQRVKLSQELALMLVDHLEGILDYCLTKVPWRWSKPSTATSSYLHRRGVAYKNLRYLLKAQRMAATKT